MKITEIKFESINPREFWIKNKNNPLSVVTAHQEMAYSSLSDKKYEEEIKKADVVTVDGVGLSWALKFLSGSNVERCSGIELINTLTEQDPQKPVFLFGGTKEDVSLAAEQLVLRGQKVVGFSSGYNFKLERVFSEIKEKKAEVVFVGMGGTVRQIEIVNKIKSELNITAITVGGGIDLLAGKFQGAPQFVSKIGLEWLWRMVQDPKKLAKLPSLFGFVIATLREKMDAN